MASFKGEIKKFIPESLLRGIQYVHWTLLQRAWIKRYARTQERVRGAQRPLNVVFFVIEASNWKYDYLYRMLEKDKRFNVTVVVCEKMDVPDDTLRMDVLHRCLNMCKGHGYNVISSLNEQTGEVFDPQTLQPDIIFYCNPYKIFYRKEYYIDSFPYALICYANYSYEIIPFRWVFNDIMQNLVWRYFCESEGHQRLVAQSSPLKGWNTVVSGYPVIDAYMHNKATGKEWKIADRKVKRIIWAPHQSIFDAQMSDKKIGVQFSTFLLYADFMLELAEKYQGEIQIAFKPHPSLKQNLYIHSEWGREKTDTYYAKWENGENTCFVNSDYIDLFCSSDALIHDCGSFTAEYICTGNPCLYLSTYMTADNMNEMGKEAFLSHYQGMTKEDIERFVKDVVLGGKDTMKETRQRCFEKNLLPPNGVSVAENIINEISRNLEI